MTVLRYVFPLCLPKLKAPIYPINYCYCYEALVRNYILNVIIMHAVLGTFQLPDLDLNNLPMSCNNTQYDSIILESWYDVHSHFN